VHKSAEFGPGPLVIKVALVMSDQLKTKVVILCRRHEASVQIIEAIMVK
jgi:hypothetical protein